MSETAATQWQKVLERIQEERERTSALASRAMKDQSLEHLLSEDTKKVHILLMEFWATRRMLQEGTVYQFDISTALEYLKEIAEVLNSLILPCSPEAQEKLGLGLNTDESESAEVK